ncbi:MAG: ATP-dependent DNA ligase [Thermoplasmata archaeon]
MEFSKLVRIYEQIESTTKRLQMTDYLVELFQDTPPDIIGKVVYLTQGGLYPGFVGIELGVAERLTIKAIAMATGIDEDDLNKSLIERGDVGEVAFEAVKRKKQTSLFTQPLSVERVYESLNRIATSSGARSQDLKLKLIADIIHDSTPVEAKYIARFLTGKLRLGIADMTLLDALALTFGKGKRGAEEDETLRDEFKKDRDIVERTYNIYPDMGRIASILNKDGIRGIKKIKLASGIPVRSMLAERLPSIQEIFEKLNNACSVEYKYDGLRVQAHVSKEKILLFSRNLENTTEQFPDVQEALRTAFTGRECILDGECVPINPNTNELLPFQQISHRRGRKYEMTGAIGEYPVVLFLFDCLYADGESLLDMKYLERRKKLKEVIKETDSIRISESLLAKNVNDLERFFERAIGDGCEGIIAKSIADDSTYRAGARGWQWIKYKRDYKSEMTDTVDLVVVGAFAGQGKRTGTYGALLMASYDSEGGEFETVSKLGTGFDDKTLAGMTEMFKECKIEKRHSSVKSEMEPDYWFRPKHVMEVRGAEITLSPIHTCAYGRIKEGAGLAIRFPRFTGKWRNDKTPEDATTTREIMEMYRHQLKKVG